MTNEKLEVLTAEQETLMDSVANEALCEVISESPGNPDMEPIKAWLTVVYGFYDKPLPARIEVVGSPVAAFALERELAGTTEKALDCVGISDAGWVAFYDYFIRIGVLEKEDAEDARVLLLRDYTRHAWDSILLDECAIIVARPSLIVDQNGDLHSAEGPALKWQDGGKEYAWHGVWVPERVVMRPRSYTREEYLAITDTEVRRALCEAAGWDHVTSLLGAKDLDSWTDPRTQLQYTLIGTDSERWLRKQSPRLQNQEQPYYVEPVHEELRTAQAARKWQATELTPQQCEDDPTLSYGAET